jgi:hypothetical protein
MQEVPAGCSPTLKAETNRPASICFFNRVLATASAGPRLATPLSLVQDWSWSGLYIDSGEMVVANLRDNLLSDLGKL